jgi:hypothetical protein
VRDRAVSARGHGAGWAVCAVCAATAVDIPIGDHTAEQDAGNKALVANGADAEVEAGHEIVEQRHGRQHSRAHGKAFANGSGRVAERVEHVRALTHCVHMTHCNTTAQHNTTQHNARDREAALRDGGSGGVVRNAILSAMPPALSATGPYASVASVIPSVESSPMDANEMPNAPPSDRQAISTPDNRNVGRTTACIPTPIPLIMTLAAVIFADCAMV